MNSAEIQALFEGIRLQNTGEVARYIPALAAQSPDLFALSIAERSNGESSAVVNCGDAQSLFTLQSVSKVFTYALALETFEEDEILSKVAVEPSGEVFDSIIKLDSIGRPFNPMVNAGAIAIAGLFVDRYKSSAMTVFREFLGQHVSGDVRVNETVARSESETGHRNRAIAHLLKHFGCFQSEADRVVEFYFRQCSIEVTCDQLSRLGLMFVDPPSQANAVSEETVKKVLSVMLTCGMYNYAGQWAYEVGIPAKSGVSGAILMVKPGVCSIGVFSPRLDPTGHSVRGIEMAKRLSQQSKLHIFEKNLSS